MPFDLQSSQKIADVPMPSESPSTKSAFDLENSEVIDSNVPRQHTYRESTNKVVDAPIGLTAEEIEYFDDAQNQKSGDFMRGMGLGIESMPATMGGAIDAAAYATGIKKGGNLPVIRRPNDPASRMRPRFGGFAQAFKQGQGFVGTAGNLIDQAQEVAGQGLASTLPSVVMSAAGTAVGAKVAGPRGAAVGGALGAFSGSEAQIPGEFFLALEDAAADFNEANKGTPITYKDIANSALLYGTPAALLDAIPAGHTVKDVTKNLTEEAIKLSAREIVKRIAVKTGKIAAEEGATEGAQEAAKVAAVSDETGAPLLTGSNLAQVGEATAAGVIGGTTMGGTAATVGEGVQAVRSPESVMRPESDQSSLPISEPSVPLETAQKFFEATDTVSSPKTQTPQFQTWFGESKAVSPEGTPLVLYHGTKADIEAFDPSKRGTTTDSGYLGKGFYFTPEPSLASLYSKRGKGTSNENVVPVYLSIKNPLTDLSLIQDEVQARVDAELSNRIQNESNEFLSEEQIESNLRSDKTTEVAMEMGYDGIIAPNPRNPLPGGKPEYVAFDPRQIKSVFNSGKFDANSDSILDPLEEGMDIYGIQGTPEATQDVETSVSAGRGEERNSGIPPTVPANANGSGGNGRLPPTDTNNLTPDGEPDREADYAKVANETPPPSRTKDAGIVVKDIGNLASDAFVPVSTRLGKMAAGLKHAVRRFVFDTGLHTHEDNVVAKPFIEKVSTDFSEGDYRVLDLALKNGDTMKIDELMAKYNMAEDWQAVRGLLDKIHTEAKEAGIEVGFIENYFPRKVKRDMVPDFLAFLRGREEWSLLQTEMKAADPDGTMTAEEQAEFANKWLRGFKNQKLQMVRPGNTKERRIDYITPEMNRFYEDSMPTLINYIAGMRHGIESRKLFGASEKETDQNIGEYVLRLIEQGVIKPDQETQLRRILKAVVEPTGTRGAVTWAKNASYIYTMGSPISALTQLQDLAFSLHENGYYNTAISFTKAIAGRSKLTKEDLGISHVLQEFEDGSRSSNAVKKIFHAIGLSFMDDVGKQTYINASLARLKKAATKNTQEFQTEMESIFGDEAQQVAQELQDGTMSENVKYLLFSELSDVQPISLAEMPIGYLRGGNGRIFYMLKTYTVKQMDIYRREIFDELASGSVKRQIKGLKNLVSLGSALMLMGMGTDALKDLILGREIDLDDLTSDNILKTLGFTKYQIYTSRRDGIMNTFWKTLFVPPIGAPVDDLVKDVTGVASGDKDVADMETLGKIPVVGKFYYWWWGAGAEKE